MATIRFALIGTGNIATTYARAIPQARGAELTAVVSRSTDRAASFIAEHGLAAVAGDGLAAIADGIDAVAVATPSGLHAQAACAAAGLGKHVLVDKPLDVRPAPMDEAIAACDQAGCRLGVCYQRRARALNRALKELFDAEAFGRILAVDGSFRFYRDQAYYDSAAWRGTRALDGGGPFMQQASHDIDLLCWWLGRPRSVVAQTGCLAHQDIEVEDHGAAVLELAGGGICSLVASTIAKPGYSPTVTVITERGSFSLQNDAISSWAIEGVPQPTAAASGSHNAAQSAAVKDCSDHVAMVEDLVHAIGENRPPLADGRSARQATDVICAIYQAATSGRRVVIA